MPMTLEAKARAYDIIRQTMILIEDAADYVESEQPKPKRKYTRRNPPPKLAVKKMLTRRGRPAK